MKKVNLFSRKSPDVTVDPPDDCPIKGTGYKIPDEIEIEDDDSEPETKPPSK